ADLLPGATFSDLQFTNTEAWWHYFRLDRVKVRVPRRQRAGYKMKKVQTTGYVFGAGVVSQELVNAYGEDIINVQLTAQTSTGGRANWVHDHLHLAQVARALGHSLATDSFSGLADTVGIYIPRFSRLPRQGEVPCGSQF